MRADIWREFWMWFQELGGGVIEERALPSSNNAIIYAEHLLNSMPPRGFIIKHQFNLHLSVWKSPRPLVVSSPSSLLFPSVFPQVPDYHNGSLWWWCSKQQYGNATYHSPHYESWMHYVPFIWERSVHYELNSSVESKRDVNFMSCTLLWRYSGALHALHAKSSWVYLI